jgi:molybdopterin molybdotransferase
MSGAPLPEGADAVVKFEDVEIGEEVIQVKFPVSSGDGLWQPGSFWDIGETLVEQGERIRPYNIFKLAEAGIGTVEVFRKPKLAIFAVGDELIAPGMPLREASRYGGLQYFIRSIAGQPQRVAPTIGMHVSLEGIIPDSVEAIEQAFHRAFAHGVDIVITTGGTGKGVKVLLGMDVERHKYMHRALWGQIENRNGSLIFLPKLANSATLEKVDGYIVIEPGDGVVSKGSLCEAVVFEH